jgi:hypothetical protein
MAILLIGAIGAGNQHKIALQELIGVQSGLVLLPGPVGPPSFSHPAQFDARNQML